MKASLLLLSVLAVLVVAGNNNNNNNNNNRNNNNNNNQGNNNRNNNNGNNNNNQNSNSQSSSSSSSNSTCWHSLNSGGGNGQYTSQKAHFRNFFVIVMENHGYNQVSGDSNWQGIQNKAFNLNNYYAITHPTQPNYIGMIAGSAMGVSGNGDVDLSGTIVTDLMEAKGLSWKYYGESYYTNSGACNYKWQRRSQAPWLSFSSISGNNTKCLEHIYSDSQLQSDIASGSLPHFGFYSPSNSNNGHNNGVSGAGSYLASWLNTWYWPYVSTTWKHTLFMITWDEDAYCDGYDECNHIYSALLSPCIQTGNTGVYFNHYSIPRFIEENFKLGTNLGKGDADANNFGAVVQYTCPVPPPWCDEENYKITGDGSVYNKHGELIGTVTENANGTLIGMAPNGTTLCYVYPDDYVGDTPPSRDTEEARMNSPHSNSNGNIIAQRIILGLIVAFLAFGASWALVAFIREGRAGAPTEDTSLLGKTNKEENYAPENETPESEIPESETPDV